MRCGANNMVRRYSHVIGFDDAPFELGHRQGDSIDLGEAGDTGHHVPAFRRRIAFSELHHYQKQREH